MIECQSYWFYFKWFLKIYLTLSLYRFFIFAYVLGNQLKLLIIKRKNNQFAPF